MSLGYLSIIPRRNYVNYLKSIDKDFQIMDIVEMVNDISLIKNGSPLSYKCEVIEALLKATGYVSEDYEFNPFDFTCGDFICREE